GALKNVCIRISGLPTLTPDWPPSPKTVTNQLLGLKPVGLEACVPLSWVPPMMSFAVFTLTDRLWYWSVSSPAFIDVIVAGTFDSLGPNEDTVGVSWIHSDCTDRTARSNRTRERCRIGGAGGGP